MCGGFGQARPVDDNVKSYALEVKAKVEEKLNTTFNVYEPISYTSQVVAGANFKSPEDRPNMEEYYKYSKDVVDMPSYPAKGSIKIVDDYIVVKFRDFF